MLSVWRARETNHLEYRNRASQAAEKAKRKGIHLGQLGRENGVQLV